MDWVTLPWPDVGRMVVTGVAALLAVLGYARLVGLRSFAKMSTLDFAATVAVGSVLGSVTLSNDTPIAAGVVTLGVLFVVPLGVNALRRRSGAVRAVTDNAPTLLMVDGAVLQENLDRENVSLGDLREKLREANVRRLDQVRAVVLETTGEVSVLHGDGDVDPWLLEDVRGHGARTPT